MTAEANSYAYAGNNPVTGADPSGLCFRCSMIRAVKYVAFTRTTVNYLRYYGGVRWYVSSGGYRFIVLFYKRWSKPYLFRNYYQSSGCNAGQWFNIIVVEWGGSLLSIGLGFAAMWTGVGLVGGAIGFVAGVGAAGFAFADTTSCLSRGVPWTDNPDDY